MGAGQFEASRRMVECDLLPARYGVAVCTVSIRVILAADVGLVNIWVAILAGKTNFPEAPAVFFLMAGKTGSGQVGAIQDKASGIMFFNGVG